MFKGTYKDKPVAVKEFLSTIPLRDKRKMKQEAKSLLNLNHCNIIKFYGILSRRCAIVTEFLEKQIEVEDEPTWVNDVRGLLDNVDDDFDWRVRIKIAWDSAKALRYLHSRGVVHADVKAANFFLGGGTSHEFIVKLGDFGEAVRACKTRTTVTTSVQLTGDKKGDDRKRAGTLPFIAPELFGIGSKPTAESDVFSFGMYLVELMVPSRAHPWSDDCFFPDVIPSLIRDGKRPSLPTLNETSPLESQLFISAIEESWKSEPRSRISMEAMEDSLRQGVTTNEQDREEENDFCFEKWLHEDDNDVQIQLDCLANHQGSVIEIAGEICSSMVSTNTEEDCQEISDDLEEAVSSLDGSNACQYFSAGFAALLLQERQSVLQTKAGRQKLRQAIESMLSSIPIKINPVRDISQHVMIEDALKVLKETGLVNCQFDLQELFEDQSSITSTEGKHNLEKALSTLFASSPAAAIYTCTPISFVIYSFTCEGKTTVVIVDTHRIPENVGGNNSGIIVFADFCEDKVQLAAKKLSVWIRERILTSTKQGDLQSLVLMNPKSGVDDLDISDYLDETLWDDEMDDMSHVDESTEKTQDNTFVLPGDLPPLSKNDELLYKGHLTCFGHSSFKKFQLNAIQAVQDGRDVIVIQPTGSGKSLCYQVPALFNTGKMVVCVCPTIALIHSQVTDLVNKGIDAVAFGRCAGEDAVKNRNRVLNEDETGVPALVYTTPETFEKELHLLKKRKDKIKMIVLDEIHKAFDRQMQFREAYNTFSTLKDDFTDIPVMALTATLGDNEMKRLSTTYLRSPVLIKGSVDRSNIKFTIGKYKIAGKNKEKADDFEDMASLCKNLSDFVADNYAIIYMDFANEVQNLSRCLRKLHELEVKSFHGKGMSIEQKKTVVEEFNQQQFQVLCATESYEVGVHNPHVELVARVGCMRNMNVLLQEFGRAGRSDEKGAVGLLMVNEHRDDQHLGYWLDGCDASDVARIKQEYKSAGSGSTPFTLVIVCERASLSITTKIAQVPA